MGIIEDLIGKVVKLIDKVGSEEEKKIAHEMVDKVMPKQIKGDNIFYVKGKDTFYKAPNGITYQTTCSEKKQDKYIGCAIVQGYYTYGSKTQYNTYLKEFYGCDPKEIERYALIDAYSRFEGKKNFEDFVNSRFRPKQK